MTFRGGGFDECVVSEVRGIRASFDPLRVRMVSVRGGNGCL